MKKETKKKIWIIVSILFVMTILIGASYAFWKLDFAQKRQNTVESACFHIEFTEDNPITLKNSYPMIDEEGMKLAPYTFRIQNTCDNKASYQINLEALVPSGKVLPDKYIKANISEEDNSIITTILQDELQTEVTIKDAVKAYKLCEGILNANETKEFHLRLWMDENVEAVDDSMNASFLGKVSIVTSFYYESNNESTPPTSNVTPESFGIQEPIATEGSGLYKVEHSETEITENFSEDLTTEQIQNLKLTEYRYAGISANNYVTFNEEEAGWRLIGLVNTPEGQRLKLVRSSYIQGGTYDENYSWHPTSYEVNSGEGVNEWSNAAIKDVLNEGAYFNKTTGMCPQKDFGTGKNEVSCDFSTVGLTEEAKAMIDTITWNTGSNGSIDPRTQNSSVKNYYNYERSNNTGKICNADASLDMCVAWASDGTGTCTRWVQLKPCTDTIERTTTWKGQVGLIYPSDYGYATSGGESISRETCLTNAFYKWAESSHECLTNNWLENMETDHRVSMWTITPFSSESGSDYVFQKNLSARTASSSSSIFPSIYLNPNITIINGDGTQSNPYQLST